MTGLHTLAQAASDQLENLSRPLSGSHAATDDSPAGPANTVRPTSPGGLDEPIALDVAAVVGSDAWTGGSEMNACRNKVARARAESADDRTDSAPKRTERPVKKAKWVGKRDRLELFNRCDTVCLLPKSLACRGCAKTQTRPEYPCLVTIADDGAADKTNAPSRPGRPSGRGKVKCRSCGNNRCSFASETATSMPRRYQQQLRVWADSVRRLRTAAVAAAAAVTLKTRAIVLQAGRDAWGSEWDWTETDWGLELALEIGRPELDRGRSPTTARSGTQSGTMAGDESGPHREAVAEVESDRALGAATSAPDTSPRHPSQPVRGSSTAKESASPVPLEIPDSPGLAHLTGPDSAAKAMASTPPYSGPTSGSTSPTNSDLGGSGDEDRYDPLPAADIGTSFGGDHHLAPTTAAAAGPSSRTFVDTSRPGNDHAKTLGYDESALLLRIRRYQSLDVDDEHGFRAQCMRLVERFRGADLLLSSVAAASETFWRWPPALDGTGVSNDLRPDSDSAPSDSATIDPDMDEALSLLPRFPCFSESLVSAVVIKTYSEHFTCELLQHASQRPGSNKEHAEEFMVATLLWLEGVYRCPNASAPVAPLVVWPEILYCESDPDTRAIKRSGPSRLQAARSFEDNASHVVVLGLATKSGLHWMLCVVSAAAQRSHHSGRDIGASGTAVALRQVRLFRPALKTPGDIKRSALMDVAMFISSRGGCAVSLDDQSAREIVLPKRFARSGPFVLDIILRIVSRFAHPGEDAQFGAEPVALIDYLDAQGEILNAFAPRNHRPRSDAGALNAIELDLRQSQAHYILGHAAVALNVIRAVRSNPPSTPEHPEVLC